MTLGQIEEFGSDITFDVNGKNIVCPRFAYVNGELKSEFYDIRNGDAVRIENFYTGGQLFTFLDLDYSKYDIMVNNMPADKMTKVYENFTVDLPPPIKYFNSEITHAYKDIEAAAELHLISLLPTELQKSFAPYLDSEQFSPEEKHVVKQADLICAYIKAQFELEHGNHEFKTAKKRLENLMEQWHSQEMDYFLQVFLPSFGRSIDEIAL